MSVPLGAMAQALATAGYWADLAALGRRKRLFSSSRLARVEESLCVSHTNARSILWRTSTMPMEQINPIMSLVFLAVWLLVGRILVRRHH